MATEDENTKLSGVAPVAPASHRSRRCTGQACRRQPATQAEVQKDVEQLAMSTLSFQDYVRERMLSAAKPR